MPELVRTLRLRDLVLLIIGAVIGSGIFLVPAGIFSVAWPQSSTSNDTDVGR